MPSKYTKKLSDICELGVDVGRFIRVRMFLEELEEKDEPLARRFLEEFSRVHQVLTRVAGSNV